MSKHLEKRSFISCFEENGRLLDSGMVIAEEFDQCPMIEATTIDDYFENLLVFIDWFYADCGNDMSGKLAEKVHHRWNRINEIKFEVQAHINNNNRDFEILDLTQFMIEWWGHDFAELSSEEFSSHFWFAEVNPPNTDNGGAIWTTTNKCVDDFYPVWEEYGQSCNDLDFYTCFDLWPEDYILLANTDENGDRITQLNCRKCGCQPESGPITTVMDLWLNGPQADWTSNSDRKVHNEALENYLKRPERMQNKHQ